MLMTTTFLLHNLGKRMVLFEGSPEGVVVWLVEPSVNVPGRPFPAIVRVADRQITTTI